MKYILIFFMTFGFAAESKAQSVRDSLDTWLKEKRFTFVANSIDPLRGTTRFLTGTYYDLTVRNDSLISYLPYIGRSQMAPLTPDDNSIIFTTTDYTYDISAGKRKAWNITLNIKDQPLLSKFSLIVYNDGSAFLSTTSNFRDPVTFKGYIKSSKAEK